jgi:diadenosine tetraphosphate (Ap4A) HIT family hydrolase/predicted kinase
MLSGDGQRTWPIDWEERRKGVGCVACADGRPDRIPNGRRFFSGQVADAYLVSTSRPRGYSIVTWRGRHVAEITELTPTEAGSFLAELTAVCRAVEAVYRPVKLNLMALGNGLPHLHFHVVPRYADDPDPQRPPRFLLSDDELPAIGEEEFAADLARLRGMVGDEPVRSAAAANLRRPIPIVVVTGPPASGKSTLAATIATRLSLPLIAKDGIKERLYEAFGSGDRDWSRWLGRGTYPLIYHFLEIELRAGRSVVVEGTFGPESADAEFAAEHERYPFEALQLYCFAPDDVLLTRYEARAPDRHPGHVDGSITDEVRVQLQANRWRPLSLPGRLVEVDTSSFEALDVDGVVALAAAHVATAEG